MFETEYKKKTSKKKKLHLFQVGTSFLEDYTRSQLAILNIQKKNFIMATLHF